MSALAPRPELMILLADCKDALRDDGIRLILADWLEENGTPADQPRAELIRCQIEYDRQPAEEPTRNSHGRQARALLQRHGRAWLGDLAPWARNWSCQRGLLGIEATIASLRGRAMGALAQTETWAWVEEVSVVGAIDDDIGCLYNSPLLGGPCALGFRHSQLGDAGAQSLGRAPWIERIARLDLGQQILTGRGIESLLNAANLRRLRELDLSGSQLDADCAARLSASRCAGQLERLILWGNPLGDSGMIDLVLDRSLTRLRLLDLRGIRMGDRGVTALARCSAFSALRVLHLTNNSIGPDGAAALADSPYLGQLELLALWGNRVGEQGASALRKRFGTRVHVSPVGT
jgi:uncharacterized protein (TIGR02996 family)